MSHKSVNTAMEDGPRLCVFKVTVISADKVWTAEAGSRDGASMAKAAVSLRFPGQDDAPPHRSEGVLPFFPAPEQQPSSLADTTSNLETPVKDGKAPKTKKEKGKSEETSKLQEVPPPASPLTYIFETLADYVLASNWLLWQNIVSYPLLISLFWTSPSGQTTCEVGTAKVDLSDLLFSSEVDVVRECTIESTAAKLPVSTTDKKERASVKAKKGNATGESPPPLLQGAAVKVKISIDTPILTDVERRDGVLLELSNFCVKSLPSHIIGSPDADANSTFSLAFEIPGLSGHWWDLLSVVKQDLRDTYAIARINDGALVAVPIELSNPEQNGLEMGTDRTQLHVRDMTLDYMQGSQMAPGTTAVEEGAAPSILVNKRTEAMIMWNATVRWFLPADAAKELKENMWKKRTWHGEFARYSNSEQASLDSLFDRDHLSMSLSLVSLLDEGVCEAIIKCPLESSVSKRELLRRRVKSNDIHESKEIDSPSDPWHSSSSQLSIHVKTSRPFQPVWMSPFQPEVKLDDVIMPRPKFAKFSDMLEIAVEEFSNVVKVGAHSISSLQQNLLPKDNSGVSATWTNRSEHKEKLRKLLSSELHKTKTWKNLKEEMKERILKIAFEKSKLEGQVTENNKFTFYNTLYIQLMEIIHASITNLEIMRKEGFLKSADGLEMRASKGVHTVAQLRILADEYEVDGDVLSAQRCYKERILQDKVNPDLWLEYGLFCMRGKHRDHGEAEECFREAISLNPEHFLSLLALSCLSWHRNFFGQSLALLRKITELHTPEEFIAWVLLGQIYVTQDEKENACRSFYRAESLHTNWKATMNSSVKHQLTSALLQHPFSLCYSILHNHVSDNPYFDTALLLLDLHLPVEAQQILTFEHATPYGNIEYKLCLARAYQLVNDYNQAEKLIKDSLMPCESHAVGWILLGHLYYSSGYYQKAIDAYEKMLQYGGERPLFVFGQLELGRSYLQQQQLNQAKQTFLRVCSSYPNSSAWLGAGMAYYKEGDLKSAETALVEGNVMDPWNSQIWAYLSLVCIKLERMEEAAFAFRQSIQSNTFPPLLLDLAEAFFEKGDARTAEAALHLACKGKEVEVQFSSSEEAEIFKEKMGMVRRVLVSTPQVTATIENIPNPECS